MLRRARIVPSGQTLAPLDPQVVALIGNVGRRLGMEPLWPLYATTSASCLVLTLAYQVLQIRIGGDPEAPRMPAPAWDFVFTVLVTTVAIAGFRPTSFVYFQFQAPSSSPSAHRVGFTTAPGPASLRCQGGPVIVR